MSSKVSQLISSCVIWEKGKKVSFLLDSQKCRSVFLRSWKLRMCFRRSNWQKELVNRPDFFAQDSGSLTGVLSKFWGPQELHSVWMKYWVSAGLVSETILIMLLALGGDRDWKKLGDVCVYIYQNPPNPWLSESSRSFLMSLTVVLFHKAVHYTLENSTMSHSKGWFI